MTSQTECRTIHGHDQFPVFFFVDFVARNTADSSVRKHDVSLRKLIFRTVVSIATEVFINPPDGVCGRPTRMLDHTILTEAHGSTPRVTSRSVAAQTVQRMTVNIRRTSAQLHVPRCDNRGASVFHSAKERGLVATQTKFLATLAAAQQSSPTAMRNMAGAAGQIAFPIQRKLRRQGALRHKTTGVTHLHSALMTLNAKLFLRSNEF